MTIDLEALKRLEGRLRDLSRQMIDLDMDMTLPGDTIDPKDGADVILALIARVEAAEKQCLEVERNNIEMAKERVDARFAILAGIKQGIEAGVKASAAVCCEARHVGRPDPWELGWDAACGHLEEVIRALDPAALALGVFVSARWRHVKRGSTYTEVRRGASVQTSRPIVEGDRLVVYDAEDGNTYARLVDEFDDGRFVSINEAAEATSECDGTVARS